jgi:hypothetical protein
MQHAGPSGAQRAFYNYDQTGVLTNLHHFVPLPGLRDGDGRRRYKPLDSRMIWFLKPDHPRATEFAPAMDGSTRILPGLPSVKGKPVHVAFDGGRMTSDAGILLAAVGRLPESGADLCSQSIISRLENLPGPVAIKRMIAAMVDLFCKLGACARTVKDANLAARTARATLPPRERPHYRLILQGLHLGYYKGTRTGSWSVRRFIGDGRYQETKLGTVAEFPQLFPNIRGRSRVDWHGRARTRFSLFNEL